ncbi:DNMT1-RFD domain-containing protein [Cephalotus follicularis]|uniref:DNMT1-RFD domain-containing protein n=1 Tax=Cephalotus follicularis TaxID=3775 RepID=A0A1Q3D458_CEPFO|nr:DNMT1-RFD domain-containing protein [Cephalotus follicularis]
MSRESSDDEEEEFVPQSVENYYFVDDKDEPISFADLPVKWSDGDSVDGNKKQIFLHGTVDKGLQKIYKNVIAWKFDLTNSTPEISVLTKENSWIKLQKPRKSFEETIGSILITVYCLNILKWNPETTAKSLWDQLSKIFSLYEVRPSQNDLVDHISLISEAVKRDDNLAESKVLLTFLEEKPGKRKLSEEDVQATPKIGFIVDDDMIDDAEEDDSNEDELFDTVCAFCDNGGDLLCCEGNCLRSFHATVEAGEESQCDSLGFSEDEVEAMQNFFCKNCEYKQHQCFACGKLGSSDRSSAAEVFRCSNATCGHYYHPHCVAKLLCRESEVDAEALQKRIAAGKSFACPSHKCCVCKETENKSDFQLQFAMCRRCPESYHRKCLPREISFEEEGLITRAWDDLLPNRILIYCLKHEIDDEIKTPIRDHIKFPDLAGKTSTFEEKKKKAFELLANKVVSKKSKLTSGDSIRDGSAVKTPKQFSAAVPVRDGSKKIEKMSSGVNSLKKVKVTDLSRKSSKEGVKSVSMQVDKSFTDSENVSLGEQLYAFMTKGSEQVKRGKQDSTDAGNKLTTKKLSSKLPVFDLDANTERRLVALMKDAASSISLADVIEKHKVPSTHAYSLKNVVDKTITLGKVEGTVEAVRTALERLEEGGSINDGKAVCEPEILNQILKWKNKLKVYLAPFLYGMRYTSFGRHFTKVEKLEEIVDKLHWYVQNGDTIVDFCCGANDFSLIMKKKLEETGKRCLYKNYDVFKPKNIFGFEQRDWMTVEPNELPKGSQLIMGLNPPFGVKAALANKFIDKALSFKPKLIILIVPPETERLDQKKSPYDLVWEDEKFLSGKSFYLPGSVDQNDKQMDQWNVTPPLLYLWSHRDWTTKHKSIAQKRGHLSRQQKESNTELLVKDHGDITALMNVVPLQSDEQVSDEKNISNRNYGGSQDNHGHGKNQSSQNPEKRRGGKSPEVEQSGGQPSQDNHGLGKNHSKNRKKRRRGGKSSEVEHSGGKPPVREMYKGMPHRLSLNKIDGKSSLEGPESKTLEKFSIMEDGENAYQQFEASMSGGSRMQFGTAPDDVSRRYAVHSGGSHRLPGSTNFEEQFSSRMRDGVDALGYRFHVSEADRESEVRSQVRLYGHDPDSLRYGPTGSLLTTSFGLVGSASDATYRMNTSAMQRYAPRLDEMNHTRMGSLGPESPMVNRTGLYDARAPVPGYRPDMMGFAPGPNHSFAQHNSAGWLDE